MTFEAGGTLPGRLYCPRCGQQSKPGPDPWPCPRCEEPVYYEPPSQGPGEGEARGWHYASFLPPVPPVSLGEGNTPLIESSWLGPRLGLDLWFKLEGGNPTGSFKDRGASVLVAVLSAMGASTMADDSSGNAGASLAAYAARAGIKARLFVPEHASPRKLAQISAYGADLTTVAGPRFRCEEAARAACQHDPGLIYASHNISPYFIEGLTTMAYELLADIPRMDENWHVVLPVGGGGLLLGLARGFSRIGDAGHAPRFHMAQPAACAPLAKALLQGATSPGEVEPYPTLAEGASIPRPYRGRQVLAAVRASGGSAVMLSEGSIQQAQQELACEEGLLVEPTSALAPAALAPLVADRALPAGAHVVVVLTGTGLKAL
ncbi:MAG: pyridoxal-phosphate dependent enzyme [Candidatus Bipolaricaulota bacterium]